MVTSLWGLRRVERIEVTPNEVILSGPADISASEAGRSLNGLDVVVVLTFAWALAVIAFVCATPEITIALPLVMAVATVALGAGVSMIPRPLRIVGSERNVVQRKFDRGLGLEHLVVEVSGDPIYQEFIVNRYLMLQVLKSQDRGRYEEEYEAFLARNRQLSEEAAERRDLLGGSSHYYSGNAVVEQMELEVSRLERS